MRKSQFLPHSWDESLLDQYSVLADNVWIRLDQRTTLKAVFPLTKKNNKKTPKHVKLSNFHFCQVEER